MDGVILITLLISLAWANGEGLAGNQVEDSQDSIDASADNMVDNLTHKFLDRALPLQQADLDDTVLEKPGQLAMPLQHSPLVFTSRTFRAAPLRAHGSDGSLLQLRPVTHYMQPMKAQQLQRSAISGTIIQPARIGQFMKPPQLRHFHPVRAEGATGAGAQTMTELLKKRSGILVRWNYGKRFGFIKDDDNDEEVFFHLRDWHSKKTFPEQGDRVRYTKRFSERFGRDQAAEVEPTGDRDPQYMAKWALKGIATRGAGFWKE